MDDENLLYRIVQYVPDLNDVLSFRLLGSNMNRKIHTEFEPILNTMLSVLPSESGALLLYSLIQTHPSFLEVVVSSESNFSLGSNSSSRSGKAE